MSLRPPAPAVSSVAIRPANAEYEVQPPNTEYDIQPANAENEIQPADTEYEIQLANTEYEIQPANAEYGIQPANAELRSSQLTLRCAGGSADGRALGRAVWASAGTRACRLSAPPTTRLRR